MDIYTEIYLCSTEEPTEVPCSVIKRGYLQK